MADPHGIIAPTKTPPREANRRGHDPRSRPLSESDDIPIGLCQCGCGQRAPIAQRSNPKRGYRRGDPLRYLPGHNPRRRGMLFKKLEDGWRVEDRGYQTPCWIWMRSIDVKGYGIVPVAGRHRKAHVLVYERQVGRIPDGLQLDHLCRVRNCVNPEHLEPVTNAENARRGANAKLTREGVAEIRRALAQGITQAVLAKRFGVCTASISHVATGRTWR